jgi:hypothetical protein
LFLYLDLDTLYTLYDITFCCSNRYIWDYVVDFHAWLMPWPNYFVLAPNIRFFQRHGVKGIFEEGNYKSYGGDLEAMKSYLMTKLSE